MFFLFIPSLKNPACVWPHSGQTIMEARELGSLLMSALQVSLLEQKQGVTWIWMSKQRISCMRGNAGLRGLYSQ